MVSPPTPYPNLDLEILVKGWNDKNLNEKGGPKVEEGSWTIFLATRI